MCKILSHVNRQNWIAIPIQRRSQRIIATPKAESAFCPYTTCRGNAFSTSCLSTSFRASALPLPTILRTPACCRCSTGIIEVTLSRTPWQRALITWPRDRLVVEMPVTWPRQRGSCLSPKIVGLTLRLLVSWFRAQWISFSYKHESLSSAPVEIWGGGAAEGGILVSSICVDFSLTVLQLLFCLLHSWLIIHLMSVFSNLCAVSGLCFHL